MLKITDNLEEVEADRTGVVAFTASWCQPCKALKPHLVQASTATERNIYIVDVEKVDQDLVAKYAVRSVPTVIVYEGDDSWSVVTGRTKAAILEEIG